jgi:hypothetical protein
VNSLATLDTLATVIRSKNASPFRLTIDIFFESSVSYRKVKNSGVLTTELVARLYNVSERQVEGIFFVDQALGIKITIIKEYPSDHFLSHDCYGAQQHLPLLFVQIPE